MEISPAWSVSGGIGTVDPLTGNSTTFTATNNGEGLVTAAVGEIDGSATVTVIAAPEWQPVGNAFAPGGAIGAQDLSFYVDAGTPYVAYADPNSGDRLTVKKFDGTNWVLVGAAGFSDTATAQISLFVEGGIPYVAYWDGSVVAGKTTLRKYNGESWDYIGGRQITPDDAYQNCLYVKNGLPYLAFCEDSNGDDGAYEVSVMKYDGNNWDYLGARGFTIDNLCSSPKLVFEADNLYLVVVLAAENGIMVKKFNGSSWINHGTPGLGINYTASQTFFRGKSLTTVNIY